MVGAGQNPEAEGLAAKVAGNKDLGSGCMAVFGAVWGSEVEKLLGELSPM